MRAHSVAARGGGAEVLLVFAQRVGSPPRPVHAVAHSFRPCHTFTYSPDVTIHGAESWRRHTGLCGEEGRWG